MNDLEWSRPLDRKCASPLHAQLSQRIVQGIRSGQLGPVLPSESTLQTEFGVARSVVRQSLESLTVAGVLDRSPGHRSRVVNTRYHRMPSSSLGLAKQIGNVQTTVLGIEPINNEAFPGGALLLSRLRSTEERPIAYLSTLLPRRFLSVVEDLDGASLHDRLRSSGVDLIIGSNRTIRAVMADETLASKLDCAIGAPLLVLQGDSFDGAGRLVERFTTWHLGELVAFDVQTKAEVLSK